MRLVKHVDADGVVYYFPGENIKTEALSSGSKLVKMKSAYIAIEGNKLLKCAFRLEEVIDSHAEVAWINEWKSGEMVAASVC